MLMASSSFLSLSFLVLLFSISSANTRKWSLSNGLDQKPISIIEAAIGVSEDLLNLNGMEAKNNQRSGKSQTIVVGTWGAKVTGSNGVAFDDGAYTGIREINFEYNNETAIGSIQVTYDVNGTPFEAKKHASFIKGFTQVKISLDFPSEYIVEVSGYTGKVSGYTVVRSLTFKTNKETYGPYGVTSGTHFKLPIQNGLIVGFKGSVGYWLDYIGFHLSL
ncbi:galactose-specific lectin-like [Morus notabilis]|uniref:galactose-specific lectin-like n=1 Tax=Morus notabilis TaxID=981085 RepID=UPI000CED398D|nr:galactose-specific lectin-like [Morus notabilis]